MIKPPLCAHGRPSHQVCFSEVCPNYPFICCSQGCHCSDMHEDCQFFSLEGFLKKLSTREAMLEGREKQWVEAIRNTLTILTKAIKDELAEFENWLERSLTKSSDRDNSQLMTILKSSSKVKSLKGSSINLIYKQSRSRTVKLEVRQDSQHIRSKLHLIRKEVEQSLSKIRQLYSSRDKKTERSTSQQKHERSQTRLNRTSKFEESLTEKSTTLSNMMRLSPDRALSRIRQSSFYQDQLRIDSAITGDTETLRAIFYPQKVQGLRLLFRASNHNFRISKFHEQCDQISETLILVKSEMGRVIGGFTPLPWRSTESLKKYADQSGRSFLFSLTFKQRYPLVSKQHAIYCSKNDGPNFGHGPDLVIRDEGSLSGKSCLNFPSSYCGLGKYERTRSTFMKLLGQESPHFKVVEWQVHKAVLL